MRVFLLGNQFQLKKTSRFTQGESSLAQGNQRRTQGNEPKSLNLSYLRAPVDLEHDRSMEGKLATSSIDPCKARDTYYNAQTSKTSELAFESRVSRYERTNRENQDPSHLRPSPT